MHQSAGTECVLFTLSATGEALPELSSASFRVVPKPQALVVFEIMETRKGGVVPVYRGNDRAAADQTWAGINHGIYMGATADNAWTTLGKRA